MSICNLKMFPANRVKSLFGLTPDILAQVIVKVLPVLEEKREQRLRDSTTRKRRFVMRDGRPREVLPIHQLLMTLIYLRHNVAHTVVGQMFGFSADSAENAFADVIFVLRDLFPTARPRSGQATPQSEMESRRG